MKKNDNESTLTTKTTIEQSVWRGWGLKVAEANRKLAIELLVAFQCIHRDRSYIGAVLKSKV